MVQPQIVPTLQASVWFGWPEPVSVLCSTGTPSPHHRWNFRTKAQYISFLFPSFLKVTTPPLQDHFWSAQELVCNCMHPQIQQAQFLLSAFEHSVSSPHHKTTSLIFPNQEDTPDQSQPLRERTLDSPEYGTHFPQSFAPPTSLSWSQNTGSECGSCSE